MLIVISPAKNLDYETPPTTNIATMPALLDDACVLIERCRELAPQDIGSLMKISDKLADLNAQRYADWHLPFTPENAKQAVLAFNGDVYTGLDATSLSEDDLQYAQTHLRILSGLYGLLKPLDLMQPYRLEMGTSLANVRGKNLYEFWGETITQHLNTAMQEQGDNVLVNLASNEYFKSVKKQALDGVVITPVFKDMKNGQYKVISFFAKKARGLMARYILEQKVADVEQLRGFDYAGYCFNEAMSAGNELVFTREEQV